MDAYFWTFMILSFGLAHGFLFDEMSDGMRCKGVSMLCPPMCRKYDSSGCVICDCNHINPAMPMDPSNSHFNPANPMNGGSIPGSSGCNLSWTNCACAPSVDAATGCVYCPCGQNNQQSTSPPVTNAPATTQKQQLPTNHVTSSGTGSVSSNLLSTNAPATTQKQQPPTGHVISGGSGPVSSSVPSSSVLPTYTSVIKTTAAGKTTQPVTTAANIARTTQQKQSTPVVFNTKLPDIATTPAPSVMTSHTPTTTTQAAFVCPGVFNCSLDCYAGFSMDSNGCPKCQCAPIPTDLP